MFYLTFFPFGAPVYIHISMRVQAFFSLSVGTLKVIFILSL